MTGSRSPGTLSAATRRRFYWAHGCMARISRNSRVGAGVLLAAPGRGGDDLSPESAARFPFFELDYTAIRQADPSGLRSRRQSALHAARSRLARRRLPRRPGSRRPTDTLRAWATALAAIAGLDAKETEAEVPDALEATRRMTFAWLSRNFDIGTETWDMGRTALRGAAAGLAILVEKGDGSQG